MLSAALIVVLVAGQVPTSTPTGVADGPGGPDRGDVASIPLLTQTRPSMGSVCTVTLAGVDPDRADVAFAAAFAAFDRVDLVMNEWRPESPLSALNAAAGGGWTDLPGDLCEVLRAGVRGAEQTGGRFDPTWAAVSDLWRFDGTQAAPPDPALLSERCRLVGIDGLALRPRPGGACSARLARAGMRVGLGGLAKGWAVDRAAAALRALGVRDFLLQAGGDLYAAGRPAGRPWKVAVRDPRGDGLAAVAAVEVEDQAFSTSGDSERWFEAAGRRFHHVLDPRTCWPAEGARSASVLAATALEAEVLTKAVLVEGGAAGLGLAEAAGVEAVVVDAAGRVLVTPGLERRLMRPAPAPPRAAPAPISAAPAP